MPHDSLPPGQATFRTTRWSIVLTSRSETPEAKAALDELCEAYWYPLYAYLRRSGQNDTEARDLVQGFVAHLLEGDALSGADPGRGPFRAYLMGAMRNHAANTRRDASALKRGGGHVTSLDGNPALAAAAERFGRGSEELTPEEAFEHAWALQVIDRATQRLRTEYADRGRVEMFDALADTLDGSDGNRTHAERAEDLGCTIGAVKVNAHRLRQRLGDLLREEVSQTVDGAEDVDSELRHLVQTLGGRFSDSP